VRRLIDENKDSNKGAEKANIGPVDKILPTISKNLNFHET
jgi:hypothetical protein